MKPRFHRQSFLNRSATLIALSFAMGPLADRAHALYASWDWTTGNWTDAARWSSDPNYPNNGQPNPGDSWTVNVSSGTITRNISPTISTLDFSGGTIKGTGVLTVTGSASWSGGRFETAGANFNGGATVTGNAVLSGSSATLTLGSGHNVTLTGSGMLTLDSQAGVANHGTLLARNDQGIYESGSGSALITNSGTLTRDTGTGTFVIQASLINTGTIRALSGTLDLEDGIGSNSGSIEIASGALLNFQGGSHFNAGSSFSGSGQWRISGGEQHVHTSLSIPNSIDLKTAGKITVYGGGTLTMNGALNWNGGRLSREANLFGGAHGYATLNGGSAVAHGSSLFGLTVSNPVAALTSVASGAVLRFEGDAVFSNAGTLALGAGTVLENSAGSDNAVTNSGSLVASATAFNHAQIAVPLTNTGTVTASAGWLNLTGGGSSTGTFQSASGASINWQGNYTFNPGSTFTGAGRFSLDSGTHTLAGSLTTAAEFDITSLLQIPTGTTFTQNGNLFFSGDLTGGGSIAGNSTVVLAGGSVTGSTLQIGPAAAARHRSLITGNTLTLHNSGLLRNEGTLTAEETGGIAGGTGSGNRFENAGTFIRGVHSGIYTISATLENTGTIQLDKDKLALSGGGTSSGGTWVLATGTTAELSGAFAFSGTNAVTGDGSWVFGTTGGAGAAVTHTLDGTLTLGAPVILGNSALGIAPAAAVTATAAFDALKGSLTGGGTLHANGGTTVGDLTVDGATLALGAGSENIHVSTTPLVLSSGGAVTNAGTFRAQGSFDFPSGAFGIAQGTGAAGAFSNSGSFIRETDTGYYVVGTPFHNSGTVSSQSGILGIAAGGSSNNGFWDSTGGLLVLQGDFTFDGTTTLTGTSLQQYANGQFTVNGPFTCSSGLDLSGLADFSVQPSQVASFSGALWLSPYGTDIPTITGGGTVDANGGMQILGGVIDGTTVNLGAASTASHTGTGALTLTNTGIFNNAGTYQASGDGSITQTATPGNLFQNSGTFTRDVSAGTFTVSAPFSNSGTVNGSTGTLAFTGSVTSTGTFAPAAGGIIGFSGTGSFDSATPFTGAGEIRFTAGTHGFLQSGTATPAVSVTGGEVDVPAGSTLDLTGPCSWSGGTIGGTGTFQTAGGLTLTNTATLAATTLRVPASASAIQSGVGALALDGTAVLDNAGIWHAANSQSISQAAGTGGSVQNSGTFLRDTDAGTFVVSVPLHNTGTVGVTSGILSLQGGGSSSGTFDVAEDTDLSLSGSNTFSAGASVTGTGRLNLQSAIQTIADDMPSSATVNLSGATLSILPAKKFTSAGFFHWTAGTVTGGGTLESSGALDLTTASRTLDGAVLATTATGSVSIQSAGTLILANAATVENSGFTLLLNDGSVTPGDASAVAFNNSGTVTRETGTGTFTIAVPFNHSGLLNLNTGSLALSGGGTASNSTIHALAGTGLYVGNNYTFGPDNFITGSGATHFSNGSLHVTGSLTTDGSFNWSGGTLDGGGIFTVRGGLSINPAGGGVFINGSTLENATGSEAVISGASATNIVNGGTYRNSGITRLRGNNNFTDGGGGSNRIVNSGTLVRDQGTGSYVITVPVENSGIIQSTAGGLYLNAGGNITGGSLEASGGSIYLNGGSYSFAGGELTGSDWIYLTSGTASVDADTGAAAGPATGGFGIAGNGATLTGSATLSVERGYFSSGQISGSCVIRLTGESTKDAYTHLNMSGGTIRNDGSWNNLVSANVDLDNTGASGGGTIDNRGAWTLAGASTYHNSNGGGQIQNHGLFRSTSGQSNILAAFHHHDGSTLRAASGSILLSGGGTMAAGSTIDTDGSGYIYFYGGTHTLNGGTLTGSSHAYVGNTAVVDIAGNVGATAGAATGGFGIAGNSASVTGSAMLSADHGYFSSGQISGSCVIRLTGESTKDAYTHLNMSGGTIRNDGSWNNLVSANIDLDNTGASGGGTIDNRGTWTLAGASTYHNSNGGGQIQNLGLFRSTSGQSNILAAFHHHDGSTLRAASGSILLSGGGTMAAGSTIDTDGSGYIYFYGGTHTLNGGTLTGSSYAYVGNTAVVDIAGDVGATAGAATGGFGIAGNSASVTGSATLSADHGYFSSGQISGSCVIRLTGESAKDAYTQISMNGGTIRNEGTWNNAGAGNFDLDNGGTPGAGTIDNRGTWNINGGTTYHNSNGSGEIRNHGVFQVTSGGSNILGAVHHHDGSTFRCTGGYVLLGGGGTMEPGATLDADIGGYIYFNGGTHTLNGGNLTGSNHAYSSAGTTVVAGDVGATTGAATGGYGISGGTVTGSAMISSDHGWFSSGQVNGTCVVRLTGESSKASYSQISMNGGTIRNDGTWNNAVAGNFDLDNGGTEGAGTIDNRGTWNLNGGTTYYNSNGSGQVVNRGLFHSTAGGSNIQGAFHHIDGSTLRCTSGYLLLSGGGSMAAGSTIDADGPGYVCLNGGTHTLNGGSLTGSNYTYSNAGTTVIAGDVGATTGSATGGYGILGGNVTGTGTLSADHGWFSSGQVDGTCVIRLTGESAKGSYTQISMNGGTIRNDGTWNNAASGNFDLDNGGSAGAGTIDNRGTWNLNGSTTYYNSNGGGQVFNRGLFHATAGSSNIQGAFHHTAGSTLRCTSGYLLLSGGGSMAAGSTIDADGPGYVYFYGGTHTLSGGTLTGSNFTHAGIGTVNITGDVGATTGPATGGFSVNGSSALVTGTAMISADHGYFSTGQIAGTCVIRITGASTKESSYQISMSGGTILNEGEWSNLSSGNFDLDVSGGAGGGALVNAGTWTFNGSSTLYNSQGGGTFTNTGSLVSQSGNTVIHCHLDNSGSLTVGAGYLNLNSGSSHTGPVVANGGVGFNAGIHTMAGTGAYLGGSGYNTGTLTLSDGASIRPGNSPGNFTTYGTLAFAPGGANPSVVVDLESASSFDSITLGNGSLLALGTGLTNLVVQASYQPVAGTVFRIVTADPGSGSFTGRFRNAPASGSVVTGTFGTNTIHFRVTYDASGKFVDLTSLTPYQGWAEGKGLAGADAGFGADPDMDGIPNGVEFVIGGEPNPANPGSSSTALMPQITVDATHIRFVFRRSAASAYLDPAAEYDADLAGPWTRANDGENGVAVTVTPDGFSSGIDRVEVLIPRTLEVAGRLFARLNVVDP